MGSSGRYRCRPLPLVSVSYGFPAPVTAEVAVSSPAVPAIHSKSLRSELRNPEGHKKDTVLRPFCVSNAISIGTVRTCPPLPTRSTIASVLGGFAHPPSSETAIRLDVSHNPIELQSSPGRGCSEEYRRRTSPGGAGTARDLASFQISDPIV